MKNEEFLEVYTETGRFTYGNPRNITICDDGKKALFLRSASSSSAKHNLYELDISTGREHLVIDVNTLPESDDEELSESERRLRERLRESAQGISSYDTDAENKYIACSSGAINLLYNRRADILTILDLEEGAVDLTLSPDGNHIAYSALGNVWSYSIANVISTKITPVLEPGIVWGEADFIAAEELQRYDGFWWSPDSSKLLITKVDERQVAEAYISNPASYYQEPHEARYPFAGTANATVSLIVFDLTGKNTTELKWDNKSFEYLSSVSWSKNGIVIQVIDRSQKNSHIYVYASDLSGKEATTLSSQYWIRTLPGIPVWWDGKLVYGESKDTSSELIVGNKKIVLDRLILRGVSGCDDEKLYFTASPVGQPEKRNVYLIKRDNEIPQLISEGGYILASFQQNHLITVAYTRDDTFKRTNITNVVTGVAQEIGSYAKQPDLEYAVNFHQLGKQKLSTAIVLPKDHKKFQSLPVIMSPYGGPHHQEVLDAKSIFNLNQWIADQGFAVILCDGRGTPGRGAAWEYAVHHNLADPVLEDQVTALQEAKKLYPILDLDRVGIRGWSFGGYLAMLAILDKPDLFKAAVAGAPVTEWRLYDTYYTEQFLGHPDKNTKSYDDSSVLRRADKLQRPLLLVHGFSDDNVLVAHSLQFSSKLLELQKSDLCTFVPLAGQTHMASSEDVTKALLKSEINFFKKHLNA